MEWSVIVINCKIWVISLEPFCNIVISKKREFILTITNPMLELLFLFRICGIHTTGTLYSALVENFNLEKSKSTTFYLFKDHQCQINL